MGRPLLWVGAAAALALVVLQLVLPGRYASGAERRLEENGGTVEVEIRSFPAVRLLWGSGDRIEVRGTGTRIPLAPGRTEAFEALDGFDEVDVLLEQTQAGPADIQRFTLARPDGDSAYSSTLQASISLRELAQSGGEAVGGPLGSALGGLAAGVVPLSGQPVPIDVELALRSDGGRPVVEGATGTVAGLPAGPVVAAVAAAVASRL